jgi:beta-N-acetylhexosaminidase
VEAISDLIESPEDEETAQLVADKALTLVKNEGELLPLRQPASACYYLLAAGRFSTQGRDMMNLLRARAPKAKVVLLDPDLPAAEFQQLATETGACSAVVVAAYVTSGAFRGNVALSGNYPAFVDQLLASGKPVALVALGNPYLLRAYPGVQAYLAAFSTVLPSETAAVRALFGQVAVRGKLPVTIPGLAEYGFGLKMEARQ